MGFATVSIIAAVIGYGVGSFPTAYVAVRLFSREDIRLKGSGNVGAANVYKVTESRFLSLSVGIIDIVKGAVAFYLGSKLGGDDFFVGVLAGAAAVAGHNYPVWLRFRGGRGLATAAGMLLIWAWVVPVAWALLWVIARKITHNTHISNIIATLLVVLVVLIARSDWLYAVTVGVDDTASVRFAAALVGILVLAKHIDPVLKKQLSGID